MKGRNVLLGLCVFAVVLVAALWAWRAPRGPYAEQIRLLREADVEAEVASAVARGDHRLVGVMEDGLTVPGVPEENGSRSEVRVIPNTSDAIESPEHGRLQQAARSYARRYNRALLQRLAAR